jgi:hypothetical protein
MDRPVHGATHDQIMLLGGSCAHGVMGLSSWVSPTGPVMGTRGSGEKCDQVKCAGQLLTAFHTTPG